MERGKKSEIGGERKRDRLAERGIWRESERRENQGEGEGKMEIVMESRKDKKGECGKEREGEGERTMDQMTGLGISVKKNEYSTGNMPHKKIPRPVR